MHKLRSTFSLSILTFLLAFAVLAFFYGSVLLHPNDYIFAPGGDGIKNYYAYMFHARYDSDFWNFGGMNYPFFEHIVYTDGHPLLSWLIGSFGLSDYGIGIVNFLMLVSFPVCAVFLYRIIRHYGVSNWWSIAAAIVIAFMSPQVYRMTGHLSLSYVFAIPGLWWFLIKSLNEKGYKWSVAIALYLIVFFFTHPYLGMILVFFSLFFWLVQTFFYRESWKKNLFRISIQDIFPVVLFQVLVKLTDTHAGRVGEPAGFFDYHASWKSVFVAHDGPMSFFTKFFKVDVGNWESLNYVGFPTVIFAFFLLFYLVKKRKEISVRKLASSELGLFIIAAWLILLFAFCFPLKYPFLRWVVDVVGPLKQFRILGRFGWIFFYVFTVFSVVGFFRVYTKKSKPYRMAVIFWLGILFYGLEFYPVHQSVSQAVSVSENVFKPNSTTPEMRELIDFINQGNYDALMVLPFQHMSSENIMILGTEQANYDAFLLSYHTQTPLMNSVTSRMSLNEAILFNNFFSPEFIEKELVYELPEDAHILIVRGVDGVTPNERRLIHTSDLVFENNVYKAFDFNRDGWNTTYYFNEVLTWESEANTEVRDGWKSGNDSVWFVYESFDNEPGESFSGAGAMHRLKGGYDLIYELDTRNLDTGLYTVSFWYSLMVDRPDVLALAEQDSLGERNAFWFDKQEVSQSTFIVNGWCFVTLDFHVSPLIEKVNLLITGNGNGQPYYIDELLITKQGQAPLFKRAALCNEEYIVYNNYWIRVNSFKPGKKATCETIP